jgi:Protein of unknown function (DUF1573)
MMRYVLSVAVATIAAGAGLAQTPDMPEKAKDFGPSSIGPVLVHYFPIENNTKGTVKIGAPRIGCGCVSVSVLKGELAPGEKTYMAAYMDTKKIPQTQRNQIKTVSVHVPFIVPNQPLREIKVDVTTVGREDMSMSPDMLALGTVKKGTAGTSKVTVTLFSPIVWNLTEVKSTGQFVKAEFKKVTAPAGQTAYEITATVLDTCPAGNWMSDVFLKSATPGLESYRIPVTVNVVPAIAAEPGALKLGEVQLPAGTGVGPRPRITVNGLSPFKILKVNAGDKQISAKVIYDDARSSHVVELELSPEKAGEFVRDIEIVTDSKEMPSVIVPVSATVKK